ncbi:hypothetical protein GUITHDRAFT_142573 [Guillardia theta CCMP2712]|uniref:Uncharacterized protein n=1 Tax=Guillardia theta (strain CCMP2712) TaxID=905079 RepID=L1IX69_GUITC|nr:hypothetical protein GUITHDRAFT_142573 [Guillardia theta CCMP2712]EKX40702.1 hypothetical protein GUITHDRAFT_142573 [Guillardia theta CCMP2712]|eukprot:XP_005827682.1 hypothetical protein GUITHDRAFT_142573 [Guillardia theta CCMP2712]
MAILEAGLLQTAGLSPSPASQDVEGSKDDLWQHQQEAEDRVSGGEKGHGWVTRSWDESLGRESLTNARNFPRLSKLSGSNTQSLLKLSAFKESLKITEGMINGKEESLTLSKTQTIPRFVKLEKWTKKVSKSLGFQCDVQQMEEKMKSFGRLIVDELAKAHARVSLMIRMQALKDQMKERNKEKIASFRSSWPSSTAQVDDVMVAEEEDEVQRVLGALENEPPADFESLPEQALREADVLLLDSAGNHVEVTRVAVDLLFELAGMLQSKIGQPILDLAKILRKSIYSSSFTIKNHPDELSAPISSPIVDDPFSSSHSKQDRALFEEIAYFDLMKRKEIWTASLPGEIERLSDELNQLVTELRALKDSCAELEKKVQHPSDEVKRVYKENEQLLKDNQRWFEKFKEATSAHLEAVAIIQRVSQQRDILVAENDVLTAKISELDPRHTAIDSRLKAAMATGSDIALYPNKHLDQQAEISRLPSDPPEDEEDWIDSSAVQVSRVKLPMLKHNQSIVGRLKMNLTSLAEAIGEEAYD